MTIRTDFEKAAADRAPSLGREFLQFLVENKKWWLMPLVLLLLLFSLLVVFATTGAAPFIYTMF
jgi:hypothetical protein